MEQGICVIMTTMNIHSQTQTFGRFTDFITIFSTTIQIHFKTSQLALIFGQQVKKLPISLTPYHLPDVVCPSCEGFLSTLQLPQL
uniref:UDP-galactose:MGDG galactosyltransferase, putative n=1 Tax=Arundo donax TaxID=35708 RepID=A0A0A9GNA1_ARUDO